MQIIDADGHVNDRACGDEIARYMPRGHQMAEIFPELDHLHLQKAGRGAFLFCSDFPHEIFSAEKCRHEINELLGREDLSQEDKEAVLGGNALRLYAPADAL